MMYWGDAHGWAWLWMLVPTLFWVTLIGFVAWVIVSLGSGRREREENALEILQRRYASGELDHEEFERRRQTLRRLS